MNKLFVILVLITGLSLAACGGGDSVRETGTVSGKQVLVGIGASDAVGIGSTDPERDNWVAQLAQRLPAGSRAINLGISSAEASRALEQELPVALDAQPTLAVVWLGANDVQDGVSLPIFGQNLAQLLHGLRADGQTRVYVANLPDLRLLPAFQRRNQVALAATVTQWNAEIGRAGHESGATVIDLYGGWTELRDHPEYISGDGLHPSTAGYRRLAELFWQAIVNSRQPSAIGHSPLEPTPELSKTQRGSDAQRVDGW